MIDATSIEFFKNLAQHDYNNQYYDFHNNYNCERLSFSNGILSIIFKSLTDDIHVTLKFDDVIINVFEMFNVKEVNGLTIDNLYRGRFETNGELKEISEDGSVYFYLEFYEGQKLEFWSKSVNLKEEQLNTNSNAGDTPLAAPYVRMGARDYNISIRWLQTVNINGEDIKNYFFNTGTTNGGRRGFRR